VGTGGRAQGVTGWSRDKYLLNPFLKGVKGIFRYGLVKLLNTLKKAL